MKPSEEVKSAKRHAQEARHERTSGKHQHDIHAQQSRQQYIYIRYNEQIVDILRRQLRELCLMGVAYDKVKHYADHGSGNGDAYIAAELVAQPAPLRLGGHDGGIGDEAQVIAEESSTHHNSHGERKRITRLLGHTARNGSECCNGTHTGAHTE